jgi:hypothetical protein
MWNRGVRSETLALRIDKAAFEPGVCQVSIVTDLET